jgi:hypothetical protein
LWLSIRDLGDRNGSGRTGWGLWLSIRDLRDDGAARSGWGLRLSIRDLRDDGAARSGWGLRLSVRDLSDGRGCGSLRLSIRYLGDSPNGSSRRLAIRALTNWVAARTTWEEIDEDGLAVRGPLAVIQVVEVAAQALVEDVGSAEGKRAIVAGGEAVSVDSSGLGRGVELELVVGGDISSSSLGILQFAIGQSDDKAAWVTTSTLRRSVSHGLDVS